MIEDEDMAEDISLIFLLLKEQMIAMVFFLDWLM